MAEQFHEGGHKNEKVGEVVSTKMAKTIVVEVSRRVPHPLYKRIMGAHNAGARRLRGSLRRGGDRGLRAGLGDVVTASVREAAPDSSIKKGKVVRCVIVRMRKETRRRDGSYIRFDSNAAVLINEVGEPVGTRVFGPVARELRDKRFMKIVSLAPEVI